MSKYQSSNIDEISLADALEFVVDNRGKTVPTDDKGIALIATNCISNDHIYPQKQNIRYVSQDIFDNWFRAHPKSGDIILTNKGSNNGEVCLVPNKVDFCIAQDMVAVRADKKKIDPLYLFAALRSPIVQKRIKYLNVDAVIPHFKKTDFNKLLIPLPDKKSQEIIGKIYFDFSNKIENLRRQNETLEQIAQTLFKHWFIDFEFPNTDGKPYKSSGGAMFTSAIGDIPEGWKVGKLGDIGKNIRDSVKEGDIKPDMSYIGLEHIPRKQIALDTWETAIDIASNKFWFNKGNILFGKLRPYFHKVGIAFTSGVCSTDILVIDAKQKNYFGLLLMLLSSEQFIYYVSLASEGTRMPRTSWEYMRDYPVAVPQSLILESFNNLLTPFIKKMEINIYQIQTLTKTRDSLLPKLMSGQLRVKE